MILKKPAVIWFTGLSGSGKSTLAQNLVQYLRKEIYPVESLDGDLIRSIFPTGFSQEERENHIRRMGYMASRLEAHGVFVVASFISPYEKSRQEVRNFCNQFIEIYVSTPLEICEKRDPKKLYKKARTGEIENFTGIDAPYEKPKTPDIIIDTSQTSTEDATRVILSYLEKICRKE